MDFIEFKNKSEKELRTFLEEHRSLLHTERAKLLAQTSKENHKINKYKKTIARILMLLRSKKIK